MRQTEDADVSFRVTETRAGRRNEKVPHRMKREQQKEERNGSTVRGGEGGTKGASDHITEIEGIDKGGRARKVNRDERVIRRGQIFCCST